MFKREHQHELQGLDDLVNYAFLIHKDPAVVLLKDLGFLRGFYFQGPDLDYSASEELERLSYISSQAFKNCGDGWMLHVHSFRKGVFGYLPRAEFPDPVSAL